MIINYIAANSNLYTLDKYHEDVLSLDNFSYEDDLGEADYK